MALECEIIIRDSKLKFHTIAALSSRRTVNHHAGGSANLERSGCGVTFSHLHMYKEQRAIDRVISTKSVKMKVRLNFQRNVF